MIEEKIIAQLEKYDNGDCDWKNLPEYLIEICKSEIAEAKPKWISVRDRLPEQNKAVLIKTDYGKCDVCTLWIDRTNNFHYWVNDMRPQHTDGSVTHWMPLPESPKEKL